ncbi:hypothetical protein CAUPRSCDRAFT_12535 [Caulochytrium protostelioides]|nr:hypothetical protein CAUPRSCDRAFT_12535 [Caulochytrium protostelioides]
MYETRWVRDDLGMYGINADGSIATVAAGLEGVGDRPVHLLKDEDGRPRLHAHPPPPKRRGAVAPYCRRLVRALHPDELPLVLIETWRSTAGRGGAPPTPALPSDLAMRGFLIRDRESDYSPFTNLRAEQCRILSTERLKRRLGELELAESGELTDVHNRYYDAMDLVRLRIAQLQMS